MSAHPFSGGGGGGGSGGASVAASGSNATSSEAAHGSVFGNISAIADKEGAVSILIIVCVVVLLERLFEFLDEATHESFIKPMVIALKNEMMIVGTMAFMFKIVINSGPYGFIESNWLFALEYADTVIPITAFCFCAEGVFIVLLSYRLMEIWSMSDRLTLVEVLVKYFDDPYNKLVERYSWLRISTPQIMMEFRVFHTIFCDSYEIQPSALEFNDYVSKVAQNFVVNMVKLGPLDWAVVLCVTFLNWGRNALHLQLLECRKDGEEKVACIADDSMRTFTIFGSVLFVWSLCFVVASRVGEIRLIKNCKKLHSAKDYPDFLKRWENEQENIRGSRLNEQELKRKVEKVLKARHSNGHHHSSSSSSSLLSGESFRSSISQSLSFKHMSNIVQPHNLPDDSKKEAVTQLIDQKLFRSTVIGDVMHAKGAGRLIEDGSIPEIVSVYLFNSPQLYFGLVRFTIIIISLYNALWLSNFVQSSYFQLHSLYWGIVSILPGIASFIAYTFAFKSFTLLRALTFLDFELLQQTIEDSETSRLVASELKAKLMARVKRKEKVEDELKGLFDIIDGKDGNGRLSRSELRLFLEEIGVLFSRKKWHRLFHDLDRNFDDEISVHEFFMFVFPEHEPTQVAEHIRLDGLKAQIKHRITLEMWQESVSHVVSSIATHHQQPPLVIGDDHSQGDGLPETAPPVTSTPKVVETADHTEAVEVTASSHGQKEQLRDTSLV